MPRTPPSRRVEPWHAVCPLGRAMTRILVVDDDAAVRSVVTEALLEDGYQVDAAGNGRQALAAFREQIGRASCRERV